MLANETLSARNLRVRKFMSIAFPTKSMVALLTIAIVDLVSTAILHSKGLIVELNPLMRGFINQSEWLFAFVKGMTIGVAWGTMVWYAQQNRDFVNKACTYGSIGYLVVWTTWFFGAR
jgi:hypothetical protein